MKYIWIATVLTVLSMQPTVRDLESYVSRREITERKDRLHLKLQELIAEVDKVCHILSQEWDLVLYNNERVLSSPTTKDVNSEVNHWVRSQALITIHEEQDECRRMLKKVDSLYRRRFPRELRQSKLKQPTAEHAALCLYTIILP